jgi:hypothetical protein
MGSLYFLASWVARRARCCPHPVSGSKYGRQVGEAGDGYELKSGSTSKVALLSQGKPQPWTLQGKANAAAWGNHWVCACLCTEKPEEGE